MLIKQLVPGPLLINLTTMLNLPTNLCNPTQVDSTVQLSRLHVFVSLVHALVHQYTLFFVHGMKCIVQAQKFECLRKVSAN